MIPRWEIGLEINEENKRARRTPSCDGMRPQWALSKTVRKYWEIRCPSSIVDQVGEPLHIQAVVQIDREARAKPKEPWEVAAEGGQSGGRRMEKRITPMLGCKNL